MRPAARPAKEIPTARRPALLLLVVACLQLGAATAAAEPLSLGARQTPLAFEPEYGDVALSAPGTGTGVLLVSTREGVEVRLPGDPGGIPVGEYRVPGVVEAVAAGGSRAYLFQGNRGLSLLDVSTPAAPILVTSLATPRPAKRGAILADGSCVAASDSFVQIIRLDGGDLRLVETLAYADDRRIRSVAAQGDSILVVGARLGVLPRLYLTVYRFPAGASSVTRLNEWIFNGRGAVDAVWRPPVVFVADGNSGITSFNTATGALVQTLLHSNGLFARALDEGAGDLFVVGEAASLQRFTRFGALGESLLAHPGESLELEPHSVAVDGTRAIVTTRDVLAPIEPDEAGRSQIEFPVSSSVALPPIAPVRHMGRSRRVVVGGGYAYVADHTGGLRIYRAGGADTSLVGVMPTVGSTRPNDLALAASDTLLFLASGSAGLQVVNVSNPASPFLEGSLVVPGIASAVAVLGPSTVAVARRGGISAGVTLVDVSIPTSPFPRGSVDMPFIQDPRALAARDTVLFVADELLGVRSIGFGDLDAPNAIGSPSGAGADDLDLQGTLLLVASRSRGLQVVDATDPAEPLLRYELPLPRMFGVTRQGSMAVGCLGGAGVALVDVSIPTAPSLRSIVPASGIPRDAVWTGDTLLVVGGTSIDRFLLSPGIPGPAGLSVTLDPASGLPRAALSWSVAAAPGQAGWNVYREIGDPGAGSAAPGGARVNPALLGPAVSSALDDGLLAGFVHRYRLEAVFQDGRALTVAEGTIFVPSKSRLGRPYPNPFRPADGSVALPFSTLLAGGTISLRVVDVGGRLVREIVQPAPAAAGFGEIRWDGRRGDGRRAASGVYYLYVSGAGVDDARPVVHLR